MKFLRKIVVGLLLTGGLVFAQNSLPEAPGPQPVEKHVQLWTFRKGPTNPLLSTNKKTLTSKTFLLSTGLMVGSMAYACSHSRQTGEEWHSEVPAVIAESGLSFLAYRGFSPLFSVGIGGYATTHYFLSFRN
jgi:hypothetical protein